MITVVTIDFWNTLFDHTGGVPRNLARKAALAGAVASSGNLCEPATLERAYEGVWEYFDDHWLNRQRTPTSEEMVREMCRQANITLPESVVMEVAESFSRGILDHPPSLLPGVDAALEFLASRAKLAVISDTAFSGGAVLREVMEGAGIAKYFSAYVFSDETGVAKPHPEAFQAALGALNAQPREAMHIGDIERTDIRGAKNAGMKAILYRGGNEPSKYAEESTMADLVMDHWDEMGADALA
ncbi:MAG: hypothetical protein JWQ98_1495 [Chlorobi bacterium]|nr:hypothetical protein [Chlorobiota bacterium]